MYGQETDIEFDAISFENCVDISCEETVSSLDKG